MIKWPLKLNCVVLSRKRVSNRECVAAILFEGESERKKQQPWVRVCFGDQTSWKWWIIIHGEFLFFVRLHTEGPPTTGKFSPTVLFRAWGAPLRNKRNGERRERERELRKCECVRRHSLVPEVGLGRLFKYSRKSFKQLKHTHTHTMACATLKRSLEFDPMRFDARPSKRRRCAPMCSSPASAQSSPKPQNISPFGEVATKLTPGNYR